MTTMQGMRNQQVRDLTLDASGTITTGGTAQLVLPERLSTTMLLIQNVSATATMFFSFGSAVLSATLTGTKVTSVSVVNAGFNFTYAPTVEFQGGGNPTNTAMTAAGLWGYDSPTHPARATCVMTSASPLPGLKIASVTVDDGGSGYRTAPYCWVKNSQLDPFGVATPTANGAGTYALLPYGSLAINDFANPTDPIAVYCATTTAHFSVKWRP